MDTVFVTVFPTTIESFSCRVRKLISTWEYPTALMPIVLLVAAVTLFFCSFFALHESDWSEV